MASTLFTSHAMLAAYADARCRDPLPTGNYVQKLCGRGRRCRSRREITKNHTFSTTSIASSNYLFSVVCGPWRFLALCRRILHHVHHVHRGKLLNLGDGGPIERQTIAGL